MDHLGKATLEDDHNVFSYLLLFPAFYVSYLRLPANGIRQWTAPRGAFLSRAGKKLSVARSSYTLLFQPQRHSQNPKNWECLCQGKSEEPKRRRSSGRNSSLCLWGFGPISMVRICRSDHDWHKQYTMVQIITKEPRPVLGGGVAHAGNWRSSPEALKLRYWNHNPREVVQDLSLKSNWTDCQD